MPEITKKTVAQYKLSLDEIYDAIREKFGIEGEMSPISIRTNIELVVLNRDEMKFHFEVTENERTRPVTVPEVGEPATTIPAGPGHGGCGQPNRDETWNTQEPAGWNTTNPVEEETTPSNFCACGNAKDVAQDYCDACNEQAVEEDTNLCENCGCEIADYTNLCEDCEMRTCVGCGAENSPDEDFCEDCLAHQAKEQENDLPIVDDGGEFESAPEQDNDLPIVDDGGEFEGNDENFTNRLGVDDLPIVDGDYEEIED